MDNHQEEVAKALSSEGYLVYTTCRSDYLVFVTELSQLIECLAVLNDKSSSLRDFPSSGSDKFARILCKELGLS
jgi:UDP-N-acetylglucosamine transferase subunit ALG13